MFARHGPFGKPRFHVGWAFEREDAQRQAKALEFEDFVADESFRKARKHFQHVADLRAHAATRSPSRALARPHGLKFASRRRRLLRHRSWPRPIRLFDDIAAVVRSLREDGRELVLFDMVEYQMWPKPMVS